MSRAYTRAQVAAMPQEQLAAEIDDVNAWIAAGSPEGQAPPDLKRADGYVFTRSEVDAMSAEEIAVNTDAISRQLAAGGIA